MERKDIITNFLDKTNPEDYDFKNEMSKYYEKYQADICMEKMPKENQSNIDRFEAYRNADAKLDKKFRLFDCDSWNDTCELSTAIYEILWNYEKNVEALKWEWTDKERSTFYSFGPDTMNSFTTTKKQCCDKAGKIIEDGLEEFAGRTHTIGNFVLVPYGFNRGRYLETKDYWDLSLYILKKDGYTTRKGKRFKSDNFSKYINTFFLWDYVYCDDSQCKEGEYKVKSLFGNEQSNIAKEDSLIGRLDEEPEERVPKNKEIENFLKNVNWAIKRRGIFMVAMLRIAMLDVSPTSEKWNVSSWYKLIMKDVLYQDTVMEGYGKVFENIRTCLKDYNVPEDIETILSEAEAKITANNK
jgi:hypothetical protein